MPHAPIERADAQAGTRDDAGTPALHTLLVALLGGATAWSVHLLASYTLLAYACSSGWTGVRPALVAIALLALAVVTGLVLSLIFAIGIVYGGVIIFLAPLCPAGVWS